MNKIIAILLCHLWLLPTTAVAQPTQLFARPLYNYFLDNNVPLEKGLNCMVVTSKKQFDKLFGIAKTMTNKIDTPDFSKEMVLVLAMPPTEKQTVIKYGKVFRAGNFISVECMYKKSFPLTYTMLPIALAIVPKDKELNTVKFYENKKLIAEVKVRK